VTLVRVTSLRSRRFSAFNSSSAFSASSLADLYRVTWLSRRVTYHHINIQHFITLVPCHLSLQSRRVTYHHIITLVPRHLVLQSRHVTYLHINTSSHLYRVTWLSSPGVSPTTYHHINTLVPRHMALQSRHVTYHHINTSSHLYHVTWLSSPGVSPTTTSTLHHTCTMSHGSPVQACHLPRRQHFVTLVPRHLALQSRRVTYHHINTSSHLYHVTWLSSPGVPPTTTSTLHHTCTMSPGSPVQACHLPPHQHFITLVPHHLALQSRRATYHHINNSSHLYHVTWPSSPGMSPTTTSTLHHTCTTSTWLSRYVTYHHINTSSHLYHVTWLFRRVTYHHSLPSMSHQPKAYHTLGQFLVSQTGPCVTGLKTDM